MRIDNSFRLFVNITLFYSHITVDVYVQLSSLVFYGMLLNSFKTHLGGNYTIAWKWKTISTTFLQKVHHTPIGGHIPAPQTFEFKYDII